MRDAAETSINTIGSDDCVRAAPAGPAPALLSDRFRKPLQSMAGIRLALSVIAHTARFRTLLTSYFSLPIN
ncbi:hypothetical protein QBD00_003368 [Ochrobactrum sp. AN78]|nr:hypothetical protein [Ochrobactrum sp. AN78]